MNHDTNTPAELADIGRSDLKKWVAVMGNTELGDTAVDKEVFFSVIKERPADDDYMSMMRWFCFRWTTSGMPVFKLTHGLAASLILTDCGDVPLTEIKLPFAAIAIELPRPREVLFNTTTRGDLAPTRYLLAQELKGFTTDGRALLSRAFAEYPIQDSYTADTVRGFTSAIAAQRKSNTDVGIAVSLLSEDSAMASQFIRNGYTVDDWINHSRHPDEVPDRAHTARMTLRLISNLCLYLGSIKGERLDVCRDRRQTEGRPQTWTVGRDVKLPGSLLQSARSLTIDGEARPMWHLRSRFVVRGHWRNQAIGPKHQQHKRLWIAPHWKGPEGWNPEGPGRSYDVATISERGHDQ